MAKPEAFHRKLRKRVASVAIGPSTIRSMGPKGTAEHAKGFLRSVRLEKFSVTSEKVFRQVLNQTTNAMLKKLPKKASHWGMARKVLNIFLRDAAYNRFTTARFGLKKVERWMEVPLDSHVGKCLRATLEGAELPRWKTVKGLKRAQSDQFQEVARAVAKRMRVHRVDLDVYFWGSPPNP